MIKALAVVATVLVAEIAHAGMVASDWGPNQDENGGQLAFNGGQLDFTTDDNGGNAARTWTQHLSLGSDWTMQAQVHLGDLQLQPSQVASLGMSLFKVGDPFELAGMRLRGAGSFGRFVTMHYRITPINGGSEDNPTTATDGVLILDYSATEQVLRSSFQPAGEQLVEVFAAPVNNWGVSPSDQIEVRLFGQAVFRPIVSGEVYFENFAFVPEPSLMVSIALIPLLFAARRQVAWRVLSSSV